MTDRRIERRFRRSRPTGRDLAVFVDYLCGHEGMKSDDAWLRALQRRELDPRERRLAMEIAYGSMRRRRTLDWCIERAAGRPVGKIDPVALSILRTAAYQLLFMSRVPAYSAVSEAVESARNLTHKGIASFVNAVLRRISAPDVDPAYPDPECDPVGYLRYRVVSQVDRGRMGAEIRVRHSPADVGSWEPAATGGAEGQCRPHHRGRA